jgi:hypothetical protein
MIFVVANQQNTAVSVVRVGTSTQGDDNSQDSNGTCDSQNDGNPHVNLTVEGFYPPSTTQTSTSEGNNGEEPGYILSSVNVRPDQDVLRLSSFLR